MSLARKTFLVVTITVILSTICIYFASKLTLLDGYEKIEQDDTRANVLRMVNSFYNLSQGITLSARGYAVWDDMYQFVQQPDPAFLDYLNLTPSLFNTHQANLIAILDINYNPLFLKMYDTETLQPLEIPSSLSAYLKADSPLMGHSISVPEKSGVILLDGRPMYITSLASLRTNFTGQPRGAVIFGRYIDDKVISNLAKTTKLPVSTYLLNDSQLPNNVREAVIELNTSTDQTPVYVKSIDGNIVAGYTYIKTIDDQPAFVLKTELPRRIYSQGIDSFRYFAILATLAGLAFVVVSTLLLHFFVISPLTNLSRQVSQIRASGDNSQRLEINGRDELASLGNSINGMLAVLENRTRELEMSNKELESFTYSVSHDLRAPLRAIDGFTRMVLLNNGAQLDDEANNYLHRIRENTHRMGQLIDDLLAFSRLGRQQLNKHLVQPTEIAKQVLGELQSGDSRRQIDISIMEMPPCQADGSMLHQVFANLLGNAIKYTNHCEIAKIEVGWLTQNDETVYYVKDNGAGFDMQYANKLFGVFQRLHKAEDFEGTGVGLAITHRIISRHGGRIWANAEVNKGATFFFTL